MSDPTNPSPPEQEKPRQEEASEGGKPVKPALTPEQAAAQAKAQRRFALLILPPIIIVLLLGLNVFREIQSAPPWREELSSFLSSAYGIEDLDEALTASALAETPANFHQESPFHSVGESAYYVTDEFPAGEEVGSDSRSPLPYPAEEIWCFRTDRPALEEQTLILARHEDMNNADWLLHLPDPGTTQAEIDQVLSSIGCDLERDEE